MTSVFYVLEATETNWFGPRRTVELERKWSERDAMERAKILAVLRHGKVSIKKVTEEYIGSFEVEATE